MHLDLRAFWQAATNLCTNCHHYYVPIRTSSSPFIIIFLAFVSQWKPARTQALKTQLFLRCYW